MAEPGRDQALAATFAFGVVAVAAVVAAVVYIRGSAASSFFRDGPRLVLAGFLVFSFLWAVLGFIGTLISTTAVTGCQVSISFGSAFDQLARIFLGEFIFLAMKKTTRASLGSVFPQLVFLVRFVLGGVYVGVQRPQFKPVCVPVTLVFALAIAVLAMDAFIILMLLVRASSVGIFRDVQDKTFEWRRSRAVLFILLGFAMWTALSIPMILGMPSFELVIRTVLPVIGSLIAIILVAVFHNWFNKPQSRVRPSSPTGNAAEDFSPPPTAESASAVQTRDIAKPVIGPSAAVVKTDFKTMAREGPPPEDKRTLPIISRPSPGQVDAGVGGVPVTGQLFPPMNQASAVKAQQLPSISQPGLGQADAGVGGVPVTGQLFPPPRAQAPVSSARPVVNKTAIKGGKLVISYPVTNDDEDGNRPDQVVPTVDLETAARNEKAKREAEGYLTAPRAAEASNPARSRGLDKTMGDTKQANADVAAPVTQIRPLDPIMEVAGDSEAMAASTWAEMSPRSTELRRRSPRQQSSASATPVTPMTPLSSAGYTDKTPGTAMARSLTLTGPEPPSRPASPPKSATQLGSSTDADSLDSNSTRRPRSSSAPSSPRRSRAATVIFTDPNPPPRIPSQYTPTRDTVEILVPPIPPLPQRESTHPVDAAAFGPRAPLASLSRSGSVKSDIRPSRQKTESPPPPVPMAKTPVQMRHVNGIPNNPRSRSVRRAPVATESARETKVLFVDGANESDLAAADEQLSRSGSNASKAESVANGPTRISRKPAVDDSSLAKQSSKMSQTGPRGDKMEADKPSRGQVSPPRKTLEANKDSTSRDTNRVPSPPRAPRQPPTVAKNIGPRFAQSGSRVVPGQRPGVGTSRVMDAARPRFSVSTTVSSVDDGQSEIYEPSPVSTRVWAQDTRRQSSPVLPADDLKMSITSQETLKGRLSRLNPGRASKGQPSDAETTAMSQWLAPQSLNAFQGSDSALSTDDDDGRETVMVMLDQSTEHMATDKPEAETNGGSWHRRVGQECPAFSDRMESTKRRSGQRPPPLPLAKASKPRGGAVAYQPQPVDSPQSPSNRIQQELRKLEEPDDAVSDAGQGHMSLLADIESEMGLQENQWRKMRQTYARESTSTIASSPKSDSPTAVSPMQDEEHRDDYGVLSSYSPVTAMASQMQISRPSRPSAPESLGQGKAVEARDDAAEPTLQDDEPTPKQTRAPEPAAASGASTQRIESTSSSTYTDDGPGTLNMSTVDQEEEPLPSLAPKPRGNVARKEAPPFDVASTPNSVTGPLVAASDASSVTSPPQAVSAVPSTLQSQPPVPPIPSNRATRPPRRSRRITALPDIVENPEPLADSKGTGTLGLFQFPWGERSDTATIPLRDPFGMGSMNMGMPLGAGSGMLPGYPSLASQNRGSQPQSYPSSFFDDYDDDDDDDSEGSSSDEESLSEDDYDVEETEGQPQHNGQGGGGDSFDDTTLWEIANLLRTDKVPSRKSLFPEISGDRRGEAPGTKSDNDIGPRLDETQGLAHVKEKKPTTSQLWTHKIEAAPLPILRGLADTTEDSWKAYTAKSEGTARGPSRQLEPLGISSDSLWISRDRGGEGETRVADASTLWADGPREGAGAKDPTPPVREGLDKLEESGGADSGSPSGLGQVKEAEEATRTRSAEETKEAERSPSKSAKQASAPQGGTWFQRLFSSKARQEKPVESATATKDDVSSVEAKSLWSHGPQAPTSLSKGMPQPSMGEWTNYLVSEAATVKSAPRATRELGSWKVFGSRELWAAQESKEQSVKGAGFLWQSDKMVQAGSTEDKTEEEAQVCQESTARLWQPRVRAKTPMLGISNHSMSPDEPMPSLMRKGGPLRKLPLGKLESNHLWLPGPRGRSSHDWISLCLARPSTPGAASSASDGGSPFTDASSVYSARTGASTLGSIYPPGSPAEPLPRLDKLAEWETGKRQLGKRATEEDWTAALNEALAR
ncbi:hypothetical protein CDD82_1362 [Ophiocordyceps australis]|uniref:Uncharacterized protein n=1 Tax=Ophiocordyceps australis TaxID=1399860 RepID=A0A2C5ZM11_9HYPO|nr:hypothetical protein CDD82_1362 [Ophiocordyceps australis]